MLCLTLMSTGVIGRKCRREAHNSPVPHDDLKTDKGPFPACEIFSFSYGTHPTLPSMCPTHHTPVGLSMRVMVFPIDNGRSSGICARRIRTTSDYLEESSVNSKYLSAHVVRPQGAGLGYIHIIGVRYLDEIIAHTSNPALGHSDPPNPRGLVNQVDNIAFLKGKIFHYLHAQSRSEQGYHTNIAVQSPRHWCCAEARQAPSLGPQTVIWREPKTIQTRNVGDGMLYLAVPTVDH